MLTTEFVDGISVFRALEILRDAGVAAAAYEILDELCGELTRVQSHASELALVFRPYEVDRKLQEILVMLADHDPDLAGKLAPLRSRVVDFFEQAEVPFRDATPKNVLLNGIFESDVVNLEGGARNRFVHIDLGTLMFKTFRADDFVSILFHYMIADGMRNELCRKYNVELDTKENILAAFIRLGRFWVRRDYYRRYSPAMFSKRYAREDLSFYDAMLRKYATEAIRVLKVSTDLHV